MNDLEFAHGQVMHNREMARIQREYLDWADVELRALAASLAGAYDQIASAYERYASNLGQQDNVDAEAGL